MNKLSRLLQNIKSEVKHNKGTFYVAIAAMLVVTFLGIGSIFPKNNINKKKVEAKVLGTKAEINTLTPTQIPTPTLTPPAFPKTKTVLASTPTPTHAQAQTPTPTQVPTSTPTPTQNSDSQVPTSTPVPTLVPTSTPTPTLTPTPTTQSGFNIEIKVDYAGQKTPDTYAINVTSGQTAWAAVSQAIGIGNLTYTDYGGDLGIFITGFNGIAAAPNQYYEFRVNGASSNVGVSSYVCNNGDKLDFVLTTF